MAYVSSQLDGAELLWLLEVTLRGEVYRFAEQDVNVGSTDGSTRPFAGTLEPIEYPDDADPFTELSSSRSIGITLVFTEAQGDGWAAIAAADQDLGDASAVLSLWRVGDTYGDRQVILSGRVDETDWGTAEEPVSFSIRADAAMDRGQLPPPTARASETTWAEDATYWASPKIRGQLYPMPIGYPGRNIDNLEDMTGSPALAVRVDKSALSNTSNASTFVIGYGELTCVGGTVTVRNVTTGDEATATAQVTTDDLGTVCTTVSVSGAASGGIDIGQDDSVWACFRAAEKGGVRGPRGGTLEGAGDVIRWLLGRTTLTVNSGQIVAPAGVLNAYRLAFFINNSVSPFDILRDLMSLLPASLAMGESGVELRHWKLDATSADAVERLDLTGGRHGFIAGKIGRTSTDDVANVLSIDYARDPGSNQHRARRTYGPSSWPGAPAGSFDPNPLCSASFTRFRDPDGRPLIAAPIVTDLVQDGATASAILDQKVMRHCGTHMTAQIGGVPQHLQWLQPGAVVLVNSPDHMWADQVALVTEVIRTPGDTALQVLAPNHWIRDA